MDPEALDPKREGVMREAEEPAVRKSRIEPFGRAVRGDVSGETSSQVKLHPKLLGLVTFVTRWPPTQERWPASTSVLARKKKDGS